MLLCIPVKPSECRHLEQNTLAPLYVLPKLSSDENHSYLEYDVVRLHGISACEGRRAGEQLEHEHAEGPVVGADVVPLVQDHLGRHVLGGAAESPRLATHLQLLGEAEVHQLYVAGGVEQEVLGLQVPANKDTILVSRCNQKLMRHKCYL